MKLKLLIHDLILSCAVVLVVITIWHGLKAINHHHHPSRCVHKGVNALEYNL